MGDLQAENNQLRATVQQLVDDKNKLAAGLKQKIAALIQQKKDYEMSAMRAEQRGQQLQMQLQQRGGNRPAAASGPPAEGPEADMLRGRIVQMEQDRQVTHAKIKMKLQQIVADKHSLQMRVRELEQSQVDPMQMFEMRKTVAILFNEKQTLTQKYSEQNVALQNARMWLAQNNQLKAQLQKLQAERGEAVQVIERINEKASKVEQERVMAARNLAELQTKNNELAFRCQEEKGSLNNASLWEHQNSLLRYQIQKLENGIKMLDARVKDVTMTDAERATRTGAEQQELERQAAANEEQINKIKEEIAAVTAEIGQLEADKPLIEADIANCIADKAGLTMRVRGLQRKNLEKGEAKMRQELLDIEEEMNNAILENERLGADLAKVTEWNKLNKEHREAVKNMLTENNRMYETVQRLTNPTAFQDEDEIDEIFGEGDGATPAPEKKKSRIPPAEERFSTLPCVNIIQEDMGDTDYDALTKRHEKLTSGNLLKEVLDAQKAEAEAELARRNTVTETTFAKEEEDGVDNRNIRYMEPKEGESKPKYPLIKSATFEKLVERLTFDKYGDMDFISHFMLTYRSMVSPIDLMEAVILRYCMTPPPDLSPEELKEFKIKKQTPVRLRVFNILKSWMTEYYYDFAADERLAETLTYFCDEVMVHTGMGKAALQLKNTLEKAQAEALKNDNPLVLPPPPTEKQKIKSFERADNARLAKAITYMESEMYYRISPRECFGLAWSKKRKEELAPNILVFVRRFNDMSMWVQHEVLQGAAIGKHADRAKIIKKLINLAKELVDLKNYNGAMAVSAGLGAASIYRLKNAWGKLDKRVLAEFEQLKELLSSNVNYKRLRAALHRDDPPCLPYLGMYLTDLTFIEDGNKNTIDGLQNFHKHRLYANVIREIQQYQQMKYGLEADPAAVHFILNRIEAAKETIPTDQIAYDLSLKMEPRGSN